MYKPHKPHEPHHTAPQFCGVVYVVFILRGVVAVYDFFQTACAGWFAVLGKNRTAHTANTPNIFNDLNQFYEGFVNRISLLFFYFFCVLNKI